MLYAYQLRAQTNARYQDSLVSLSQKEMRCMLNACGIAADIEPCGSWAALPFCVLKRPR